MMKLTEQRLKRIIREEHDSMITEVSISELIKGASDLMSFFKPLKNAWGRIISFKKDHPKAWKDLVELLKGIMEDLKTIAKEKAGDEKKPEEEKK